MQKKVLITGASGFAGSHLAEYLSSQNTYEITGTHFSSSTNTISKPEKIHYAKLDLANAESVENLVVSLKPDLIFHLAALSSPAASFSAPGETFTNNILAEINLLEAVRKARLSECRILIVSSADIYGKVRKEDIPIDEVTPLRPTNPYAVSKIAQDFLGLQYFLSYGMHVVRVRPFNHIGPRQSSQFVVAAFAQKIAKIEKGQMESVLNVGNLSAKRDFTDVRDMVRAYEAILEKGKYGEVYNIGTGVSHRINDVLAMLLSLSSVTVSIKTDPRLLRPSDDPELVCDNKKFVSLTGWKPEIPLKQTLKDTLDYWRNII